MTDKIQKIREGIEKLKSRLIRGACASQITMETRCKEEAYNQVLTILDSLQKEPVNEDLEEAVDEYAPDFSNSIASKAAVDAVRDAFTSGAKWQKEQMMAKAVDGKVIANGMGNPILHLWDKGRHLIDKKVKVIVIKED